MYTRQLVSLLDTATKLAEKRTRRAEEVSGQEERERETEWVGKRIELRESESEIVREGGRQEANEMRRVRERVKFM